MKHAKSHAFTLIELLVVIAIIILLVGILVPTVTKVLQLAYAAKSQAVVTSIQNAAEAYFKKTEAYYPGQRYRLADTPAVSGSQVLAAALLEGINIETTGNTITGISVPDESDIAGNFLAYKEDTLITQESQKWCLADGFPSPMAVLYYASFPGNKGKSLSATFNTKANEKIAAKTDLGNAYSNTMPSDYCWDDNLKVVKNHSTFILAAPGADRKYFIDDGSTDDIRNFNMD